MDAAATLPKFETAIPNVGARVYCGQLPRDSERFGIIRGTE